MKALYCDMCKEELEQPIAGRTYWHISEFDVCEACKDGVEAKLRPILRENAPYTQGWYEEEFLGLIEEGVNSK